MDVQCPILKADCNNHRGAKAVVNAIEFKVILGSTFISRRESGESETQDEEIGNSDSREFQANYKN